MIKGIAQSSRNNAWHTKHTKRKSEQKFTRYFRLLNRVNGEKERLGAEKQYKMAQARESQKTVSFFARMKYLSLRTRISFNSKIRKIAGIFNPATSV